MAAVVTGTAANGHVYILDRMSFRGDFRTGIGMLCDMMERNSPDYIGCEIFAFQQMYKVYLEEEIARRKLNFYVEEVGRDSKKKKAARIESLQPKIARGEIHFRKQDKPLVDQLLLWDPLSKTNTDDEIDALAWQVPLWTPPLKDSTPIEQEPPPGSFLHELEEMKKSDWGSGYINRLFGDMRHDA